MEKIKELLKKMSLQEKIALTSGHDSWRLKSYESYGIPKITLTDGPHGLRHQEEGQNHLGINSSNPSTCFPPACLTAASFDESLLYEMGKAIGYEALCQNVQVVLGPGVNIKRNPLCGRNFEYFSEDPLLAGKLASAWISGIQSMGVGACLKHFALNSQELNRMKSDSIADDKAKFDIYLKAFEEPIKAAKPFTVMGSYNLVDGVYTSENKKLIGEILRRDFGFEGVLMTDWGAMNDKIASLQAGLDLEMPGSNGYFDEDLKNAIERGEVTEEQLDLAVERILKLIFTTNAYREKAQSQYGLLQKNSVDVARHHQLARKIARESMVLLKNSGHILPFKDILAGKFYIVGALAKEPRYQGSGSSHIHPYQVSSLLEALKKESLEFTFVEGYLLNGDQRAEDAEEFLKKLLPEDYVLFAAGLPDSYESEGFDRTHMKLPRNQNELIEAIAEKTKKIAVVLFGGSPVEMPWVSSAQAILQAYLPGQAGGEAIADILLGRENPSGKLPETYPIVYEDHITSDFYGNNLYQAPYVEGIYVGYRYFDKANLPVQFPFGHGLSYTSFVFSKLSSNCKELSADQNTFVEIRFMLKNSGKMNGKEVCQVYLERMGESTYSVKKALKAFVKVSLDPGEEKEVVITLSLDNFMEYSLTEKIQVIYDGVYRIHVGSSSENLPLYIDIQVHGIPYTENEVPQFYKNLCGKPDLSTFEKLLGRSLPEVKASKPFTIDNTLEEMKEVPQMRYLIRKLEGELRKSIGESSEKDNSYQVMHAMFMQTPIKRLSLVAPEKMPKHLGETLVHIANGNFLTALQSSLQRKKKSSQ